MMRQSFFTMALLVAAVFSSGCVSLGPEVTGERRAAAVLSASLKVAYASGGAEAFAMRVERLVADGKVTREQAELLRSVAGKFYDALIGDLDAVARGEEPTNLTSSNAFMVAWNGGGRDIVIAKVNELLEDATIDEDTAREIVKAARIGYPSLFKALRER